MFKKVSPIFVMVSIVVFILSSLLFTTVSAQEGSLDPNTPISNVDGIMPVAEASGNATTSAGFAGSGRLAPESAQLAGPNSVAPFVQSAHPETVIGADGRTQVTATTTYPNRAIAYLYVTWANNTAGSCTGWFINARTVVTAGHCVYNTAAGTAHGWAKSIRIYPGRNGASIPYGYTTGHRFFSVTGWTNSGYTANDYGAIQTNAPMGTTVGWFGYAWQSSNTFPNAHTVRGYPGDKPSATLWTMNGLITAVNASRLWYSIDTYGGQSGSPLYKYINGGYYGYGIHTYGTSVSPYTGNSATRITQAVFNNFATWKAYAYP